MYFKTRRRRPNPRAACRCSASSWPIDLQDSKSALARHVSEPLPFRRIQHHLNHGACGHRRNATSVSSWRHQCAHREVASVAALAAAGDLLCRALRKALKSQRQLAKEMQVSHSTIGSVFHRHRHLATSAQPPPIRKADVNGRALVWRGECSATAVFSSVCRDYFARAASRSRFNCCAQPVRIRVAAA
jgi:hypothetical protein